MVVLSEPECVWPVGAELGEGPVWSAREGAVWFVDIKQRRIHRYAASDGTTLSWDTPQQTGFILPAEGSRWVVGMQSGPHLFDPDRVSFDQIDRPTGMGPEDRLNDGYVDAQGRLWFGSMHDSEGGRTGALYRLGDDGRSVALDRSYGITNGPCMSPDGRTFYHTETVDGVIYAFDAAADGSLSNKREFVRITRPGAKPDGSIVDAEGCLWTALFGGWGLERYSPQGELLEYVRLPVSNLTKAAFGGPDLQDLYVTTAKLHLDDRQRAEQPLAGGLFKLRMAVAGLPQYEVRRGLPSPGQGAA